MSEHADVSNRDAHAEPVAAAGDVAPASEHAAANRAATTPRGGMLLPFYLANLAAIYLPSLLPVGLEVRRGLDDELGIDARAIALDVLAAPWAGLKYFDGTGVDRFSAVLGGIGSLYAFLLTLWIGVLVVSALYSNYAHRYRLTFVLFVLSAVQAVFVAERFVAEHHQPPPDQHAGDGLPPID